MDLWPVIVFAALAGLVVLHTIYREYLHRRERLQAQQAFNSAALRQVEEANQLFKAQQAALFNSMGEGVLILDEFGKIQLINESLKQLFSLTNDITGKTLLEAFRLPQLTVLEQRLQESKVVREFELELVQQERRFLEINASLIYNEQGQLEGTIFVFHDLTRIKQLENTRQEFVANVSHELRTPLSLIKGYVQTLLDGAKDDPALTTKFLQKIEKHTNQFTYLIEDLLTISKLESGKVFLNLEKTSLKALADRVVDDLQARADEKQVKLVNEITNHAVEVDVDRMHQVFLNLVDNAIKYCGKNGEVIIGASRQGENEVKAWVKDNGPGIPQEARLRVFERFYRADRARSRDSGGTGLGLAIVKHIVQAHGGEVWVQSQVGVGSTFYFTLPGGHV